MLEVFRARYAATVKDSSGARQSREQQIWSRQALWGEHGGLGAGLGACKVVGRQGPGHALLLLGVPKLSPA